ncbi:DUF4173 domain-containing protein [Bacteroidia bacterium]|nr:DUF4173 domain-containing protein [Bacteroidia bacterium]
MKFPKYFVTLISALLFVLLFFEKSLGLNVAIYGLANVLLLVFLKANFFNSTLNRIVTGGFLITSVFYYLYASPFTMFMAIVSFALLFGLHTIVPLRNLLYAVPNAVNNYFVSISDFFVSFRGRKTQRKNLGLIRIIRIVALPFFVILLFIALYSMGSSFFSDALGGIFNLFENVINKITQYIDIVAVFLAVLGVLLGVLHSLRLSNSSYSDGDRAKSDVLARIKLKINRPFRNMDLATEYKSGVFLFVILSMLLSLLLYLEIKNVWFGFEWEGELLKELVQEGTYILIFAILISMGVTIYYFRRNLNFYSKNKVLKTLAYLWIGLNALLVISVFVRNAYYIEYFGLAYKRTGVIFFLVLCIVGLVTLMIKIRKVKSTYYVLRVNALAAYITLISMCMFNWDGIIAKYNFAHYKTAFIHLPFMSDLSDKTLPYLQLTDEEIEEIENKQTEKISFARKGYFKDVDYKNKIDKRIQKFRSDYETRHWLESVWAEDKAFRLLSLNE